LVARIGTVTFLGIEALPVDVQVQMASGLPAFTIVGLPDKAVAESRERVRAALNALGLALPVKRIIVNLAPADLLKEGSHFDLPIALGLLVAMEILPEEDLLGFLALGELALDASLMPVTGILPAALTAAASGRGLICPATGGAEAAWAVHEGAPIAILAPKDLLALINHFKGTHILSPPTARLKDPYNGQGGSDLSPNMSEIRGQQAAKRALEIAAAGGHNLLLIGPPGAGKSMLAQRLPGLLPPLSAQEALEVSMIHSVAGLLADGALLTQRPFRDPHHSASLPALIGGGSRAKPGEISLAHAGVLFLDELPEFQRASIESLRQPLENGRVTIARANHHINYPARVQLIGAMNPCRCGYADTPSLACGRMPRCARDYQARLSGPFLDRIDMTIEVSALPAIDLARQARREEPSQIIAKRVLHARQRQELRLQNLERQLRQNPASPTLPAAARHNAALQGPWLEACVQTTPPAQDLLVEAATKFTLSARAYHRILKVARTIADLDGEENIARPHIAEALSYRRLEPVAG
jgi:magnesium chelatase family protein